MAASMLRIGRLGYLKAVQVESIRAIRRAPAAPLSSTSGDGKKSKRSNKGKSTTTYFDIEKLIQHKSVPRFPKKEAVMPVTAATIAEQPVDVAAPSEPDTCTTKTSSEPAPASEISAPRTAITDAAPAAESVTNPAVAHVECAVSTTDSLSRHETTFVSEAAPSMTENAPVKEDPAPEAAVPAVEDRTQDGKPEVTPGKASEEVGQTIIAEVQTEATPTGVDQQVTAEGPHAEVVPEVTPEVPRTASAPADDLVSEALEAVADVVAEVIAETVPVEAVAAVVESLAEAVAEAAADEPVDVTPAITDAAVAPVEVVDAPEAGLDPIQKLFLDAIREYTSQSSFTGGLVDAGPEYHKNLAEETSKLQRLYGGGDVTSFPEFKFTEPNLE